VEIGEAARRGDVIARLDARPYRHASSAQRSVVAEIVSRLAQIERDRDRTRRLLQAEAATRRDLEELETAEAALRSRLDAARAQLAEAERSLGEATLRAPFDGVIAEVAVEPGELVRPGSPVAILAGHGAVEVEVEVPESLAGRLEEGASAVVSLPLAEVDSVAGRVRSVGHSAGLPGRLFPLVVQLDEGEGVLPGMTAEVVLGVPTSSEALTVPVASIVDPLGGGARVYRISGERAEQVRVTVRDLLGDRVAVEGGLEEGDMVVTGGLAGLADGLAVEVRR
jgi:RND family efflux transporter MFP subunit